jgi:hypothetical protein
VERRMIGKKIAQEIARRAMREASNMALERTARLINRAPEKIEEVMDRKKDEYLEEALVRAEAFFQEKLTEVEMHVDRKLEEIERRFEETHLKELRARLRLLFAVLGGMGLLGVLSLWYSAYRLWSVGQ